MIAMKVRQHITQNPDDDLLSYGLSTLCWLFRAKAYFGILRIRFFLFCFVFARECYIKHF